MHQEDKATMTGNFFLYVLNICNDLRIKILKLGE